MYILQIRNLNTISTFLIQVTKAICGEENIE